MTSLKIAAIALLMSGAAYAPATVLSAQGAAPEKQAWAHRQSDLAPDPSARFGQLANGMGYVIYRNATPPGEASVRFHLATGDLMESDEQNGLAHFIEHMAFNGTVRVKEGEMLKMLEREGMAFGREVNAFTAPDRTVYILDIPAANEKKIDTVLFLLRELASEMNLDPAAIDRERGIILSEDRSMYPPARKAFNERDAFLYRDQLIAKRLNIGDLDVIRTAPRERFVDYYRNYYRPERATLVVAGDIDPEKAEAEIRKKFSDWKGVGEAGAEPDLGTIAKRGFEADSHVAPGALREITLTWLRPYTEIQDTRAERIEDIRESLASAALNRRLQRLIEDGKAPFSTANLFSGDFFRSAERTTLRVEPKPGQFADAVRVAEQELRKAAAYGILQPELEREVTEMRSRLQAAAASAATRRTAALANEIVEAVSRDEVLLSPAQRLQLFEEAVRGFSAAEASTLLKAQLQGSGPLLYATSPEPIDGGHVALAQAFTSSKAVPVAAPVAVAAKDWPYSTFGAPGRVVERKELSDLGVTSVRFDNGVTLLVKPTDFKKDEVAVGVRAAGGRLSLSEALVTAPLTQGGFVGGGVEKLTEEEIKAALQGKLFTTTFGIVDNAFTLRGNSRPQDLQTQLQVLAAYAAAPAWPESAFEKEKTKLQNIMNIVKTSPMNTAMTDFGSLIRSGDRRWGFPSEAELARADVQPLRSAIDPVLKTAPLEVVIVGDVKVEDAIAQVASTFAALPTRTSKPPVLPGADKIRFTRSATPEKLQHAGRKDVAFALTAWPTDDFHDDPAEARALQVLKSVLQTRALEKIREELGASYSPITLQDSSEIFDEFGFVSLGAEVSSTEAERVLPLLSTVASDLKAAPVSVDELARAVQPMIETLAKEKAANDYWLGRLGGASWDPRRLDIIRTQEQALRKVTPADIQRVARKYLRDDAAYNLLVLPQA